MSNRQFDSSHPHFQRAYWRQFSKLRRREWQGPLMFDAAELTRRYFLGLGAAAATGGSASTAPAEPPPPALARVLDSLGPYFTAQDEFVDVSRGKPVPHSLPADKKRQVGLTRETWSLEVISDPKHPATLGRQLTRKAGTALDFAGLLRLAEKRAVRFPKILTCLNLGCPLGMGIWEGVPLRDVVWLTKPRENLRRVFYHGFHNDDPAQLFRSSLPIGRVLEDPDGFPPVVLCYKLNGQWLSARRGGPVRLVVPEGYGFKSVKWLTHVVLTNLFHANDTYADANNDIDSPLKTFAATLHVPAQVAPGEPIPLAGYAQVGVSGLAKVQVWAQRGPATWPADDPWFTRAPWVDAQILPPPSQWGEADRPKTWPLRLTKALWGALLPGLPAGAYTLRCRTIDERGQAQPMPRPFRKSGRAEIEAVKFTVRA